jgi:hypothetical protein
VLSITQFSFWLHSKRYQSFYVRWTECPPIQWTLMSRTTTFNILTQQTLLLTLRVMTECILNKTLHYSNLSQTEWSTFLSHFYLFTRSLFPSDFHVMTHSGVICMNTIPRKIYSIFVAIYFLNLFILVNLEMLMSSKIFY